jgi:hypothetical protein
VAVYVYGVVDEIGLDLDVDGVAGGRTRIVAADALAAVVSDVDTPAWRVRRRDLERHLAVLEAVFASTTVVPCAFGMVVESDAVVREQLLEPRSEELLRLLRNLEGRAQMTVRVGEDEEAALRDVVASSPEIARLRGASSFAASVRLGELVAAGLEQRRAVRQDTLLRRLAPLVEAVALDDANALLLKGSFLVDRRRLRAFDDALAELAREEAVEMQVYGPLPPTAFAEVG